MAGAPRYTLVHSRTSSQGATPCSHSLSRVNPSTNTHKACVKPKDLINLHFVAKMDSHAIFQYNVLAIDDTHNTWTNISVKMIIIRLIGPMDENPEEIRSKGPTQR